MKNKKEYLILAVLIASLTAYLVLRNSDHTLYQLPAMDAMQSGEITKIEIEKSDGSVILEKRDDLWVIGPEDYRADSKKIDTVLDTVAELTVTALVSESQSYSRYGLDPENKITIKAWAGETLARQFDIGKAASTFRHTHVKLTQDPNVYHARGNFRNSFDRTGDYYRDMTVLSVKHQDVQEIKIVKQNQTVLISRRQTPVTVNANPSADDSERDSSAPQVVWQRDDGKGLDDASVDSLLSAISRLKCDDFIDGKTKADFSQPYISVSLKGLETDTLSVFKKTDDQEKRYPAISSDADVPFVLSESKWERIASKIDEILN